MLLKIQKYGNIRKVEYFPLLHLQRVLKASLTVPGQAHLQNRSQMRNCQTILKQVQSQLPAENGTWAVFISDLVNGTEGSINDQKMQAASLIQKLYIMGAVYENYDQITGQYSGDSVGAICTP